MNVSTNTNSPFPDQVVSDAEKATLEYGLQVSRAIEQEWFNYGGAGSNRYAANWNNFHNLRLYARGEQSVQKYKDELAINGDLSYLNLDWKPVPILSKFSNIVSISFSFCGPEPGWTRRSPWQGGSDCHWWQSGGRSTAILFLL